MSALRVLILVQVLGLVHVLSLVLAQSEVQVHLGQSVVLNCSVMVHKTFWFMEIHGLHICISRIYGNGVKEFFIWTHFEKFSLEGNSLRIHNISEEDLRSFSCAQRTNSEKNFGFQEVFKVKEQHKLTTAPKEPHTTQNQNPTLEQLRKLLLLISVGLNVLFIIIIIITGLLFCLKTTHSKPELQNHVETQYDEVQLSPNPRPSPRPRPGPEPVQEPRPRPAPGPEPSPGPISGARPGPKVRSHPPEGFYSEAQMPRATPTPTRCY